MINLNKAKWAAFYSGQNMNAAFFFDPRTKACRLDGQKAEMFLAFVFGLVSIVDPDFELYMSDELDKIEKADFVIGRYGIYDKIQLKIGKPDQKVIDRYAVEAPDVKVVFLKFADKPSYILKELLSPLYGVDTVYLIDCIFTYINEESLYKLWYNCQTIV